MILKWRNAGTNKRLPRARPLAFLIQVRAILGAANTNGRGLECGRWTWDETEGDETLEDTDLDSDAGGLTAMLNLAGFRWQRGDQHAAGQLYGDWPGQAS